jgi:uncharacterized membrane protein
MEFGRDGQRHWLDRMNDAANAAATTAGRWAERYWVVLPALAAGGLMALAALAAALRSAGFQDGSALLYTVLGFLCHAPASHRFSLWGFPMGVCARDIGLFGGIMAGSLVYPTIHPGWTLSGRVLLLCALPLALDGGTQLMGLRESTNLLRLGSGLLAGGAAMLYVATQIERGQHARRTH